jgi:glycosyltransferase involved in cell wall biosynthesis
MTSTSEHEGSRRPRVAIYAATFRRPEGIRALVESLNRLEFRGLAPSIELIVVDNAPSEPAFASEAELAALSRWPARYLHEPERGIVAARNRALDAAPEDADYVASLDDDETVTPGWLEAMLHVAGTWNATAVQGHVEPSYSADPPPWVEALDAFRLGPFEDGQVLRFAGTGNVLIDAAFLRRTGLRFDPRFNDTGGEDADFFDRLMAMGGTIRAAAGAVIHEEVPPARMSLRYVMRRRYRIGNTLGWIAILRRKGRAMRFAKGVGALVLGLGRAALAAPLSRTESVRGLLEAARGAGMVAAFLRLHLAEYTSARLSADRANSGGER